MTGVETARISAVLGPTNTGKTYLAIERMLGHASGMIGFPLRLLARENYDRVVRRVGAHQVALITGEEKIVPPRARYFLCTVESMPVDRRVAFLAVDEVQLSADPERGHVFTDRLLHARGLEETMFLGADTIRSLLGRLVRGSTISTRPRFSTLAYAGPKKLTRLPPRSAVVAFSAAEVYTLAELMRRQRGGTAVVLGALSPRTRNAQVGMFESGEVDYLVATDAIGMGLNLGLDHVAFARLSKFDGRVPRRLTAAEVAQIAGRAGRHMSDGTFGTTTELGPMQPELVQAVEEHSFDALTTLHWRNRQLDFASPERLLRSLERPPPVPELIRGRPPEDQQALAALSRDAEIELAAGDREAVRLLWEVCQIPDFRKILTDQHTRLLRQIFLHLRSNDGLLPADWVAAQIARVDRTDGDIDALVARIAHVRTWTFVSHRGDWLDDGAHWQERTRAIEDELSDALHDRLTQRFVDRRTAVLVRRLSAGDTLLAAVRPDGEVLVEGEHVGRLKGFRFVLDESVAKDDARAVLTATRRALWAEIPRRLARLEADGDGAFRLEADGQLSWRGAAVARLAPGDGVLRPRVAPLDSEFLDGRARERVRLRLALWLERHLGNRLAALHRLTQAPLQGAARGLAFQLNESLGLLPRAWVSAQLKQMGKADRKALAGLGVRLGAQSVFLPSLLNRSSMRLRALLWTVHNRLSLPNLPEPASVAFRPEPPFDEAFCLALGYRRLERSGKAVALRADALERLALAALRLAKSGSFKASEALCNQAGGDAALLETALAALGYRVSKVEAETRFEARAPRRRKAKARVRAANGDSPFAALVDLGAGS